MGRGGHANVSFDVVVFSFGGGRDLGVRDLLFLTHLGGWQDGACAGVFFLFCL